MRLRSSSGSVPARRRIAFSSPWRSLASSPRPRRSARLLCVIDDAQWFDRAFVQASGLVARRLLAEPMAFLFAARETTNAFAGLPELLIEGLDEAEARKLLALVIPGRLDDRVADELCCRGTRQPAGAARLHVGFRPRSWRAGSGCRQRCRVKAGSSRPSCGGWRPYRRTPSGCCWSRRLSRSVIRRCCGARPSGSRSRVGARPGGVGRADRDRRPRALSPSARALRGPPGGTGGAAAAGASGVGRGHRCRDRSRSARLAPRPGNHRPGRVRRRRIGAGGRSGGGTGRSGRRCRFPPARRRADTRAAALRRAGACGGADQVPRGRARRGSRSARHRRDRRCRRLRACPRAPAACSYRVRVETWKRRAVAPAEGGPVARSSRPAARARHLPGRLGRRAVRWTPGTRCQRPRGSASSPRHAVVPPASARRVSAPARARSGDHRWTFRCSAGAEAGAAGVA